MDQQRRKELLAAYRDRRPEMGVIAVRCEATGETFLGISNDTRADFNSVRAKLSMQSHPNRQLQALWNTHGAQQFTFSVVRTLKYDDPHADHTKELEELRAACLAADPSARRIWK